jgi:predicted regulator of Ras-like GTPase activity (Roadblock/LC7/MglB family)
MSAMTDDGKSKFFGFLKGFFVKSDANAAPVAEHPVSQPVCAPQPRTAHAGNGNGAPAARRNIASVQVPLHAILTGLPLELRARLRQTEVGNLTVSVTLDKVLSQLAHGAVKVPFGDIRQSAPHIFEAAADHDSIPVSLPLNEILSQLNPALLVRRPAQKQVVVPAEIVSPFAARGQGLVFSVGNAKPVTPAAPRQAAPAPALPARGSISSVSSPREITSDGQATDDAHRISRGKPLPPPASAPIPMVKFAMPIAPISPITPITPITPVAPVTPIAPASPGPRLRLRVEVPSPAAPVTQSPPPAPPATDADALPVNLKNLAAIWPDALRQEIVQSQLLEARLLLPCNAIENALKRGRAAFPWRTLRSWIRPALPPTVSVHDAVELELPLKIVAPLFLARQSAAAKAQRRVTVDEAIPNLFFGFPQPSPCGINEPDTANRWTSSIPQGEPSLQALAATPGMGAGPVTKPVDTNYYVWSDISETAHIEESEYKRKSPTGTDFVARYATPNEIVSRAAALDGVAGALIALPDGLMVASRIPAELNGDTLAAFLPQIFSKVSQCTKELRMGDLNNLNFTVGNVPWKIFRVNAIFFAAFGRAAEPLPTAQLAALAAELDRKK